MVFLQFLAVCSRTIIETVDPGIADEFDQVLIAVGILGQHDEVIAAKVFLGLFQAFVTVMKFFNTEHVAVIGNRHASHAVLNSFVHKLLDTRLSIKY